MKKIYLLAVLQLFFIMPAFSQTFDKNGAWETAANWSPGSVPSGTGTNVAINANATVSSAVTIGNVDVKTGRDLTINSLATLTIGSEALFKATTPTQNNLTFDNQNLLIVQKDGKLEIWGDLIILNGMTLDLIGTMIVHGNVIMKNNSTVTVKGSGTLIVDRNFTANNKLVMENNGSVAVGGDINVGTGSTYTGTGTISARTCGGSSLFCTSVPQPVDLLYFKASAQPQGVQLEWASTKELKFSHYTVERSEDGKNFTSIHTEYVEGDSYTTKHYAYLDAQPNFGANYYRLKTTDVDQAVAYKGVTVAYAGTKGDLQVYPNPAKGELVIIKNPGAIEGTWLSIQGIAGQELMRIQMAEQELRLPTSALPTGLYIIKVWNLLEVKQARLVIQ